MGKTTVSLQNDGFIMGQFGVTEGRRDQISRSAVPSTYWADEQKVRLVVTVLLDCHGKPDNPPNV